MKFIEPSVEYWKQDVGLEGMWKQIARATRVCYQSSVREGESDEDFVKRVVLKPALVKGELNHLNKCTFDFDKMHGAMLEHATVYLIVPEEAQDRYNIGTSLLDEDSSKAKHVYETGSFFITTNLRYILEHYLLEAFQKYSVVKPISCHPRRYTFSVITDIGTTREFNRHRAFSISEESTRYCDYNKNKFGGELTFIKPNWNIEDKPYAFEQYELACKNAEHQYQELRTLGWRPEQAREVLPLGLKTQAVYTAFKEDWEHFLKLRADNYSGKAHPNINLIATDIKQLMQENHLV